MAVKERLSRYGGLECVTGAESQKRCAKRRFNLGILLDHGTVEEQMEGIRTTLPGLYLARLWNLCPDDFVAIQKA